MKKIIFTLLLLSPICTLGQDSIGLPQPTMIYLDDSLTMSYDHYPPESNATAFKEFSLAFAKDAACHGLTLKAAEAIAHVGENATVCGSIGSEHTALRSRGTPTFITLDQPYPNQVFTVLIWGSDRAAVGAIPETGRLCATGTISLYRGVPEIVVQTSTHLHRGQ
jgi:hypothetical protein